MHLQKFVKLLGSLHSGWIFINIIYYSVTDVFSGICITSGDFKTNFG